MARKDNLRPAEPASAKVAPVAGHWPEAASVLAVAFSAGLQFVSHIGQVLGYAATAVSGATILAVSVVFATLTTVASWHQIRRARQREDALDEAADASDLIVQGRLVASRIQAYRVRPNRKTV